MDLQIDRIKIGKEGFALWDEVFGQKKKPAGPRAPPPTSQNKLYYGRGLQAPEVNSVAEQYPIGSNGEPRARVYSSELVPDYRIGKPFPRANN